MPSMLRAARCIALVVAGSSMTWMAPARAADTTPGVAPALRSDFTSRWDGSFNIDFACAGCYLRIIAVGGGGGGSGGNAYNSFGRTGAGGGSGAAIVYDVRIDAPVRLTWTIGRGGAGGAAFRAFGPSAGKDGGNTQVLLSSGAVVAAAGGVGGSGVASPTASNRGFTQAAPAGGRGGIPFGKGGAPGIASHTFKSFTTIAGGAPGPGYQPAGENAGRGGSGGAVASSQRFPVGTFKAAAQAGAAGASGLIRLQIFAAAPPPTEDIPNGAAQIAFPVDAVNSLERVFARYRSLCTRVDVKCPPDFLALIAAAPQAPLDVHLASAFRAMSSAPMEALKKWLPSVQGLILDWILKMPGDTYRPEIPPLPVLDPKFASMSDAEVQELLGHVIVAEAWVAQNMSLTPDVMRSINNLHEYAKALEKEASARQARNPSGSGGRPGGGVEGGETRAGSQAERDRENARRLENLLEKQGAARGGGTVCVCENNRCECFPQ